jgi:repressor LexA
MCSILIPELVAKDKTMEELTKRQKEVLDFISKRMEGRNLPPTIREIGERFKISSTNGVRSILSALTKKGYIKRRPLVSRGIELTKFKSISFVSVPLLGKVAAGLPLLAAENVETHLALDKSFISGEGLFSLKVVGDSMIGAGIFEGDYVVARQNETAQKGDIVIAVIGDEATVKRYFPEKNQVRLEPANPAYGPIIVDSKTPGFYIAGKVVGLLRKL